MPPMGDNFVYAGYKCSYKVPKKSILNLADNRMTAGIQLGASQPIDLILIFCLALGDKKSCFITASFSEYLAHSRDNTENGEYNVQFSKVI